MILILPILIFSFSIVYILGYSWQVLLALNTTEYISRSEPFNIDNRLNVLLLAVDAPTLQEPSRCDKIKVISLEPSEPSMIIMTIPRDAHVPPAGFRHEDRCKINGINNPFANPEHFGTDKLVETVSELLGVNIDGFAKINYKGFVDVIDSIGGINVDVEMDMYVDKASYQVDLKQGLQHLDGESALKYVRFRGGQYADWACWGGEELGRSGRQTDFIRIIIKELTRPSNWSKIPSAIEAVMANVQTDIPTNNIFLIASILRNLDSQSINVIPFPGGFDSCRGRVWSIRENRYVEQDIKIVEVNFNKLKQIGQEYFSDEK